MPHGKILILKDHSQIIMQTHFFTSVTAGLTDTELKLYQELSEKIRNQVIKLEKEL